MEITITRRELLELWNGLPLLANLKGFKLGYAVARTKIKLRPEVEALDESIKPGEEFKEFEAKRMELCNKHAQKDPKGKAITENSQFVFGDNMEAFQKEMIPLNQEYEQVIKDQMQKVEDYNSALKDMITVEVHTVTEADISTDPEPTVAQMEVLYHLLQEVAVPLKAVK